MMERGKSGCRWRGHWREVIVGRPSGGRYRPSISTVNSKETEDSIGQETAERNWQSV